ncbi:acid phosphatase 1-like [Coffea eugenioides]|uniref:Acid phosphatase 1 n=1 Tax=Coffea arabica TaxID=13443 RepID=A0A6P6XB00_COFAR|nr:acid phosphatase 1-like [Coffea arabica]XP_027167191.1 acid phosphatase 1-like [Coffea eugenioides]
MELQKMAVALVACLCLLVFGATTSQAGHPAYQDPKLINPLRMMPEASSGDSVSVYNCLSWRLTVETNNKRNWNGVPEICGNYVENYMTGKQYGYDCEAVVDIAIKYVKSLPIPRDGRSIWIFDIDDTALSNLPFFSRPDVFFGVKTLNAELEAEFYEFILKAEVPVLEATLRLYQAVVEAGIKAVFLTGSSERSADARDKNLKAVGYHTWEKLILKPDSVSTSVQVFKSEVRDQLVAEGYRIEGNIGDQWADIVGSNVGRRTFKVPNPMYYGYY